VLYVADFVGVFAVLGKKPDDNKGENEEKPTNYLEDGISPTFAK